MGARAAAAAVGHVGEGTAGGQVGTGVAVTQGGTTMTGGTGVQGTMSGRRISTWGTQPSAGMITRHPGPTSSVTSARASAALAHACFQTAPIASHPSSAGQRLLPTDST